MENYTKKTHWKKLINPDYLGAYSLDKGQDLTLTIKDVKREIVKGMDGKKEECTVVYFSDQKKPMILNRTNAKTIQKIYDTPYIEEWKGKRITLFATKTRAFGEDVECLRIRQKAPQLPELKESDSQNWNNCIKALKSGYKIDDIKTKWRMTEETQLKLVSDAAI